MTVSERSHPALTRHAPWLALAVAASTVIAAADVLLAGSEVIVGLLTVGPLIAAARTGPRATALVGAYAIALALLLGVANDFFGSVDHLLRASIVVVGGVLAVWIATLRDRAERSGAQLAAARDQLDVILGGVADGITAQGPGGRLLYVNQAAAEATGFASAQELMAASPAEYLERFEILDEHGAPFPLERLPGRRALAGEPAEALLRYRIRATGEERWSLVKARPVVEEGRVIMAINIIEDVTEAKREERSERFLAAATRELVASLDHEATLRAVADLAVPEFAEWCAVDLADDRRRLRRAAVAHVDPEKVTFARELERRYPPDPSAPRGAYSVLREGKPELYPDVPPEMVREGAVDEEHLRLLEQLDLRSVIIVPLNARGRTLGTMTLARPTPAPRFDERDLELAAEVARRAALAVDNARLHRIAAETSRALQDSLLPPVLPDIPGMHVASRFRAAGEGNEVGGDFYDLFELGDGAWAIVVGDVVGKGAEAAAVTALARYTLRAAAMERPGPADMLRRLNDAMLRQLGEAQFCTACVARIEARPPAGVHVALASGGHPLPLLIPEGGGPPAYLGRAGTLLGVAADAEFHEEGTDLDPGDTVVLYTDGLTEARAPQRVISAGELLEAARGLAGLDPAAVAQRLERYAIGEEEPRRDDLAIVVARVGREPLGPGAAVSSPGRARPGRPRSPAARPSG